MLSQTDDLDDLKFLEIARKQSLDFRKTWIQTGKPIKDEVRMETIDDHLFSRFISKENNLSDENFSQNTTERLGTFGLNLFKDAPSTFAPIDLAPAPLEHILGPGDEISVQLFGSLSVNRLIPINREGNLVLPEIGIIQVSGLSFKEAKDRSIY